MYPPTRSHSATRVSTTATCWGGGRPPPGLRLPSPQPALWVDQESLEPVRFDRGDGVRFRLGSFVAFGSVRLPSWIEISDSRGFRARLEILSAQEVPASPELIPSGAGSAHPEILLKSLR